jgi:ABC-type branched-subunit amino acid transport system ATPase component
LTPPRPTTWRWCSTRRAGRDLTILLCEHDVPFVERLATRTYVLDSGHLIAEGPTHEVLTRPEVRRAYLGVAT